jgi:hypothetical protein
MKTNQFIGKNMKKSFKKIIAMIALMLSTTDFALADYDQGGCIEEECTPAPCCKERCGGFFLDAGVLYLRAFEGGLSSACDSTQIIDTTEGDVVVSELRGKNHDFDFKWNTGFTVGAGYEFDNNSCIGAFWTNYNSRSSGGRKENQHHWKINFNVVDVLYCYESSWSNFALIPYGGLRYARIDQHLRTHFLNTVNAITNSSHGHSREDFSGWGPLFGLEGNWDMGCGFSLYGNVSGSVLFGKFRVRTNSAEVFDTGINRNHLRKNNQACQPVVDIGFGVRWMTSFCNDMILVLQLGLEEHRYFNHNQLCSYGDLSLDGGSFTVGIEF